MQTADYAFLISLASFAISLLALLWNVWQKYIFVRPQLQVTFGVYRVFDRVPGRETLRPGRQLLNLTATNMGPGPVILYSCIVRSNRSPWWRRGQLGLLNPIHGDPTSATPTSLGPFSGGLPVKIDAAESKTFYFPYDRDCFLATGNVALIGINDTYGRNTWCHRRAVRKALKSLAADFPPASAN
jgi:hypothetical protein